jgi:hypothetical protein
MPESQCGPYLWDDATGACFTACSTDAQCAANYFCSGGACG